MYEKGVSLLAFYEKTSWLMLTEMVSSKSIDFGGTQFSNPIPQTRVKWFGLVT